MGHTKKLCVSTAATWDPNGPVRGSHGPRKNLHVIIYIFSSSGALRTPYGLFTGCSRCLYLYGACKLVILPNVLRLRTDPMQVCANVAQNSMETSRMGSEVWCDWSIGSTAVDNQEKLSTEISMLNPRKMQFYNIWHCHRNAFLLKAQTKWPRDS